MLPSLPTLVLSLSHSAYQAKKRHPSSRSTDDGALSIAPFCTSLSWGAQNVNWDDDRALVSFQDGQATGPIFPLVS